MAFDPTKVGKSLTQAGDAGALTGKKLITASVSTRAIAQALAADGKVVPGLQSVETGTRSTRTILGLVVSPLRAIATALRSITVPTISAQTTSVNFPVIGRVRFVTGVSLGSVRPLVAVANSVTSVADNLDNVRAALLTMANAIRDLVKAMPDIRNSLVANADDMKAAGTGMVDSGQALRDAGAALGG